MVLRIVYALCTALLCYYRHTTLFLKLLKLCAKTTWFDIYIYIYIYTRSVRKVSDLIFLCEHLMDYNLARLHEPTLNLSAHA